ncbi:calcium-binding and coiled-coil domain-containing protein 2, putative [Babesia ovata]|uniref:Calcium-binding and coiled-coil domain-containing protein 2, putative n=1 Tax=Babesia ovata TaxID=189622 RepID=A0A2H6KFN7_9APIC|nr:calcium-binding and coiled-coil domain-containing protein 2, putative [Babesia ovata]GBE61808.1 calcium-binding and coiled-coil domain-containing protein 2, putative [Babesia ovata]
MHLPTALWRYWQAIWPAGFQATAHVNMSCGMRPGRAAEEDVFSGTHWSEVLLETRGNGLFLFEPEVCVGSAARVPTMAWVLEHVRLELLPAKPGMTLPIGCASSDESCGALLYFFESRDEDSAFLAIHYPSVKDAQYACTQFRRCSLTYVRSLVDGCGDDGVTAGDVAHTIESLRYSREELAQQKDLLRLDNTLLFSQYASNKQAFSESTAMQMQENAALRSQLERCMDRIQSLESDSNVREGTIRALKEEREHLVDLTTNLQSELETSRDAGRSSANSTEEALRQDYKSTLADVSRLRREVKNLRKDNARITNQYHNYKREVNLEYERVEELLYHSTIYEMLMHWILCNDLKVRCTFCVSVLIRIQVEYYETCHQMRPEEHQAFCDRVNAAQEEFRVSVTLARASYINCRTHLFNELLSSISGHKLELPRSKRLLSLALERLDWIFQPESCRLDVREPIWMNQEKFDGLVEALIYKTSDHTWYNKLSYVSALKPILTNDGASESMLLTLKRQLYESLNQNEALKQQVASMQKALGSNKHWQSIWSRAAA